MTRQAAPQAAKQTSTTHPLSSGLLQRKCESCGQHKVGGGKCGTCQKNGSVLQRKATQEQAPSEVPPIVHEVLRSPGESLDANTRDFMESRFNHDFSQVRVHTDRTNPKASESAQAIASQAYTVKPNVVFGAGKYNPKTSTGIELLTHELAHYVQQPAISSSAESLRISSPSDSAEHQAESAAQSIQHGEVPIHDLHLSAPVIARSPDDELDLDDELEAQDEFKDRLRQYGNIPVIPEQPVNPIARRALEEIILPMPIEEAKTIIDKIDDTLLLQALINEAGRIDPKNPQNQAKIPAIMPLLIVQIQKIQKQAEANIRAERSRDEQRRNERRAEKSIETLEAIKDESEKREQAVQLIENLSSKNLLNQTASTEKGRVLVGDIGLMLAESTTLQTVADVAGSMAPSTVEVTLPVVGSAVTPLVPLIESSLPEELIDTSALARRLTGRMKEESTVAMLAEAILSSGTSPVKLIEVEDKDLTEIHVTRSGSKVNIEKSYGYSFAKAMERTGYAEDEKMETNYDLNPSDLVTLSIRNTNEITTIPAFLLLHYENQGLIGTYKMWAMLLEIGISLTPKSIKAPRIPKGPVKPPRTPKSRKQPTPSQTPSKKQNIGSKEESKGKKREAFADDPNFQEDLHAILAEEKLGIPGSTAEASAVSDRVGAQVRKKKPSPGTVPRPFERGNFAHRFAEHILGSDRLPRPNKAEVVVMLGDGTGDFIRVDRIISNANAGVLIEIKPAGKSAEIGRAQMPGRLEALQRKYPKKDGWRGEIVEYTRADIEAWFRAEGVPVENIPEILVELGF